MKFSPPNIFRFLPLCLLLLLGGCATYVDYYSNPPGAYITYKTTAGDTSTIPTPKRLEYPGWTEEYKNGGCMWKMTPTARWSDGATVAPVSIKLCRNDKGHVFHYTFQKPQQPIPTPPAYTPPPPVEVKKRLYIDSQDRAQSTPTKAPASPALDVEKKCLRMGLAPGSDDYNLCINSSGK
jgi:hypothetical protein